MKLRHPEHLITLLAALAVTLVVNFSYLLLLFGQPRYEWRPHIPRPDIEQAGEGVLSVSPDGHAYLIYEGCDSIYVPQQRVRWFSLHDGDVMEVDVSLPHAEGAHLRMNRIYQLNGEEFDYEQFFNYPSETLKIGLQLLYFLVLSLVLIGLMYRYLQHGKPSTLQLVKLALFCTLFVVGMFLLAPVPDWYSGNIRPNFTHQRMFDSTLVLKFFFTVSVSVLCGWIRMLVSHQQKVEMEVEHLKNENLMARYDMLVGQISPHFFFNSLNSLSMLVREEQNEQAIRYIEQLSYSFRYIIQNGQNMLVPLSDELRFAESFSYQYSIRYADKLFFDFDIDEQYHSWHLPALSLQPLIGNAVKHNTITKNKPLRVTIRTIDGWLEVSNPIVPKLEPEPSTGIGLQNLQKRWRLILGHEIVILNDGVTFTVRLPLQKPDEA